MIVKSVNVSFDIEATQHEGDEMISCYIPSISTYFSARIWEDVERKGAAMITASTQFWNDFNNSGEIKDFSSMKRNDGLMA